MCEHSGGHSVDDWGDDDKVLSLCCNPALFYVDPADKQEG